jgi:hypothetical protein
MSRGGVYATGRFHRGGRELSWEGVASGVFLDLGGRVGEVDRWVFLDLGGRVGEG